MRFHITLTLILLLPFSVQAQDSPLMGWSSWNTYRVSISDSLIRSQADAMVSTGLNKAGYNYINIDDGYFGGRDKKGQLLIHPGRFPEGLAPVVQHIHNLGLKAGIYSDAGHNTCGSFWDSDTLGTGVGLYGHDRQDTRFFFHHLGFDYIKVDFCGGDARQNTEQLQLSERERYTAIRKAIRRATRRKIHMNVCRWNYPGTWVGKVADSWRISHDISPSWSSVKDIIRQNLYLSAFASEGHYNDMDMLEVGRGLTDEEDRTHFGLWCMMCSPLFIGCDLTKLSSSTLALLSNPELIALNQQAPHRQAYVAQHIGKCYVLVKDIEQINGTRRAVAFYNPTDLPQRISLSLSDIDLQGLVAIRDLYKRQELSSRMVSPDIHIRGDSFSVLVPAHGTRIYALTAQKRMERTLYEAETAYLGAYQELTNHLEAHTPVFTDCPHYSGKTGVGNLGGNEKNYIQWNEIQSTEGGHYRLYVAYESPGMESRFTIYVNGKKADVRNIPATASDTTVILPLDIRLRPGTNTIRLNNPEGLMPVIDYIRICKE